MTVKGKKILWKLVLQWRRERDKGEWWGSRIQVGIYLTHCKNLLNATMYS
jgi:hypothetical protein